MGDPDKISERKEKISSFLKNKAGFDDKYGYLYIGIYAAVIAALFFLLGNVFRLGTLWLFVIIPAITIVLFFLGRINWGILLNIVAWGFIIRIQNLPLLKDVTTGQWIPSDLDPYAFLRYARYILEHGQLMTVDTLRYYPLGFTGLGEFKFLSYFIVYLYKFLSFFSGSITLELADILYPPIVMVFGIIFFYLLVKKLFNARAALIASAFLIVVPAFLYRTMGGVPDKEPFGIAMMFAAFYFYVSSLKAEKLKTALILAFLGGISTGLMGLAWGGVTTIFLAVGFTTIIESFLGKLKRKDVYAYALFVLVTTLMLLYLSSGRFNFGSLITSFTSAIMYFALGIVVVNLVLFDFDIFRIKSKIENKYPAGVISAAISVFLGLVTVPFVYGGGLGYIGERIKDIYTDLVEPFGRSRWHLTVAENHQPYLVDWVSQFGGWLYLWMFIIGSVFLFYQVIKNLENKNVWKLMAVYIFFIIAFPFSRYNSGGTFDGVSALAKVTYLGSLIILALASAGFYLYTYYKDKKEFGKVLEFDKTLTFVIVWFIISLIAARGAIRLVFLLAPVTAVMCGYFIDDLLGKSARFPHYGYIKRSLLLSTLFFLLLFIFPKLSSNFFAAGVIGLALGFIVASLFGNVPEKVGFWVKIALYCIVIFIALSLLFNFTKTSAAQAGGVGLPYNQQWQEAGKWVRENTPETAVFAHWWDYGYWVQTAWNRATLSDGGNARGAINYFVGRHVLTGQWDNEKRTSLEAMQLLKANKATHLLMVSDEIGKYTAFSSIGSDVNYDRYSWINQYVLDRSQSKETRNQTVYVYTGGTPLDEDFVYNNQLFPGQAAGVGAFFVPLQIAPDSDGKTQVSISQPNAVIVYNGQQVQAGIECVYFNGVVQYYPDAPLKGCLRFLPVIDGTQGDPLGAALYLSPKVSRTLFAHLYLFNEESENFKLVYGDENAGLPLAIYQGQVIGPIKIWEMKYPENLDIPKEFYGTSVPDPRVELVGRI
ncbi:MAG TPA: STT3 domain-containing protein [Candidatus Nanoarchaeia archaeon]|nr:STT3 domain-containing protein [Candidatus Nanoarchaeia archaeon]